MKDRLREEIRKAMESNMSLYDLFAIGKDFACEKLELIKIINSVKQELDEKYKPI